MSYLAKLELTQIHYAGDRDRETTILATVIQDEDPAEALKRLLHLAVRWENERQEEAAEAERAKAF